MAPAQGRHANPLCVTDYQQSEVIIRAGTHSLYW